MQNKPLLGSDLVNLRDVLPLDMPVSLMIDPTNLCNFKCTFCPTGEKSLLGEFKRPKGMMSFSLFKKILNDVSNYQKNSSNKIKSLLLYKDGEPLLNKDLPKMITFAKELQIAKYILVTTNASLLSKEYSEKLLNSGLDSLRVSVQSLKKKTFTKTTRIKLDYDLIKENIKYFYNLKKKLKSKTELVISYVDAENYSEYEKKLFVEEYSKFSDRVIIKPVMGWTRTEVFDWRNGKTRDLNKNNFEIKVCPDPFSRLSINFDGSASVCCVDWSHGTVVGNMNHETFDQVWNGEKLKKFRLLHLNGKKNEIGPCKNCDYIKDKGNHDNIDEVCEKLKKFYS